MRRGGQYHILVWMRDREQANRLCMAFERCRMMPCWAVSLPEAVAAADREFPHAIACTLENTGPSLFDLETLVTHLVLGNDAVSIPPIPVWALSSEVNKYTEAVADLKLPIQVVPITSGVDGLAAEIVHYLSRLGLHHHAAEAKPVNTLYFGKELRTGIYLSRYLDSCGIPTNSVETLTGAFTALEKNQYKTVIIDLPREVEGMAFLKMAHGKWPDVSVIALSKPDGWLSSMAPQDLPKGLRVVLPKPTRAEVLASCLRRILRVLPTRPVLPFSPNGPNGNGNGNGNSSGNGAVNGDEAPRRDILREQLFPGQ
jgi:hypothetical protein